MKKTFGLLVLAAAMALPTVVQAQSPAPAVVATAGKALYATDGGRIGSVYRVLPDGSAQLILQGKLVTVPASSLSVDGGKLVTSMTKAQLSSAR